MNVNGFTHRPGRTRKVRLSLLVLTSFLIIAIQPVPAATTKKLDLPASEVKTFVAWTDFLSKGTATWSTTHAPAFTPAIRSTIWQVLKTDTQGESLVNPMIDYLEWRRSLDPTRFAHYHPNLSPALAQLLDIPPLPTGVPTPTTTSDPQTAPQELSSPTTTTSPQTVTPAAVAPAPVPEPNSLLLAGAMTGWAIWWRRQLAKRASR